MNWIRKLGQKKKISNYSKMYSLFSKSANYLKTNVSYSPLNRLEKPNTVTNCLVHHHLPNWLLEGSHHHRVWMRLLKITLSKTRSKSIKRSRKQTAATVIEKEVVVALVALFINFASLD